MGTSEKKLFNEEGIVITTERLFVHDQGVFDLDDIESFGIMKYDGWVTIFILWGISLAIFAFWDSVWGLIVAWLLVALGVFMVTNRTDKFYVKTEGKKREFSFKSSKRGTLRRVENHLFKRLENQLHENKKEVSRLIKETLDEIPDA